MSPALSKFIIARFAYTNQTAIPEYFSLLPCRNIVIPRDLGMLFGYLHSIEVTQQNLLEYNADLEPLNLAISEYQKYVAAHPDWLQSRFAIAIFFLIVFSYRFQSQNTIEIESNPKEATERLPIKSLSKMNNDEAMEKLAKRYNLSLPSESDNDDEGTGSNMDEKYKLIGNVDDMSSASSSED